MNPNKSCNIFLVQALIHRCTLQVELVHTVQVRLAPDKRHVHTLQVTVRFLSVVMFPDMSCTSTWNTGAVPFSMIISSSGLTCKTLGKPCKNGNEFSVQLWLVQSQEMLIIQFIT